MINMISTVSYDICSDRMTGKGTFITIIFQVSYHVVPKLCLSQIRPVTCHPDTDPRILKKIEVNQ